MKPSAALLLATLVSASTGVLAQGFPAKPVRIIVPYAAGGAVDVVGRLMAPRMAELLGQPVLVDNRPGAGSVIGTDLAAKAAPDGYTLLMMSNTHTANETLIPNKPFALMRDFVAIAPINYSDLLLVAHPGTGINSVADLLAKAKAQPGKINYASSGPGTPYHMAGELFKYMAKVDMVHVPYKGSSGARTDVLGGQVDLMFDAVTTMSKFPTSYLASPAVAPSKKRAVIGRLVAMQPELANIDRRVRNFLFVVVDHRRILELKSIIEAFEALIDERLGFVRADVSSARDLTAEQKSALEVQLSRLAGRKAKLRFTTDPDAGVAHGVLQLIAVGTPPGEDARAWFGAVWARAPVAPRARIDTPPRARKDLRCIMGTPLRRLLPTAANGG